MNFDLPNISEEHVLKLHELKPVFRLLLTGLFLVARVFLAMQMNL